MKIVNRLTNYFNRAQNNYKAFSELKKDIRLLFAAVRTQNVEAVKDSLTLITLTANYGRERFLASGMAYDGAMQETIELGNFAAFKTLFEYTDDPNRQLEIFHEVGSGRFYEGSYRTRTPLLWAAIEAGQPDIAEFIARNPRTDISLFKIETNLTTLGESKAWKKASDEWLKLSLRRPEFAGIANILKMRADEMMWAQMRSAPQQVNGF